MSEDFRTSVLARALERDEAVVRAFAGGLPMESRVRHRVERRFTLKDALSITICDAVASQLPRRFSFALVAQAADHFERIVANDDYSPWSVSWPDPTSVTGFSFAFFSDPEAALACVLEHDQASTFSWADLVRGALGRILEAKRVAKEKNNG
ncbi:hypothetical protein [Aureimonas sp. AU20]|uniref:hypothetical protein n=1 Tax=Aureimonas sp. AU20 TaxID=1349819 RepID=UPI000720FA10|nr:hypothetical protein [Aureimonas sp. AU20]ALN73187.1 hypothetical protein M673_10680 [Aureimonas sp. AU20]